MGTAILPFTTRSVLDKHFSAHVEIEAEIGA
jgi:hypothetical protein